MSWLCIFFYIAIIVFVGFVVAQLFISVVCFGFDSLAEQLEAPMFSAVVGGAKEDDEVLEDDHDNICACCTKQPHPLEGAEDDIDAGDASGIRVNVVFKVQAYAPIPLGRGGIHPPTNVEVVKNELCTEPHQPAGSGNGVEIKEGNGNASAQNSLEFNELFAAADTNGDGVVDLNDGVPDFQQSVAMLDPHAFVKYQQFTKQVKADKVAREEAYQNRPFCYAIDEEVLEIPEYSLSDDLKVWSNHKVAILKQMLFEQEGLDEEQMLTFYLDVPQGSHTFEAVEMDTVVQELLPSFPVRDEDGVLDPVTIPTVYLQCRFKIRVVVELLTHRDIEPFVYYHDGTESIREIEEQVLRDIEALCESEPKINIKTANAFVQTRLDENICAKDMSLWAACDSFIEDFAPMRHACEFVVTLDRPEAFICCKPFDNFIMATIAVNTFFLGAEHYEQSEGWDNVQEGFGWIFNVIFFVEMWLKIFCLKGFCNYIAPFANKFDFTIVMSSVVQIIVEVASGGGGELGVLKLFRLFRAFRVVRLLRKFKSVRDILDAALGSIQPILNIMVFMMLLLIVFGCLGMQLYGQKFNFEGGRPRQHFDDFLQSFYTLFQVLTGSAWEVVLYDCMRAEHNGAPPKIVGWAFITMFFLLSNYIVLNLFIGAILSNMSTDTDDDRLHQTAKMKQDRIDAQMRARSAQVFSNSKYKEWAKGGCKGDLATMQEVMQLDFARQTFEEASTPEKRFGIRVNNKTFCYFDPYNPIRRAAYNLVTNPTFDMSILVVIIFSTILLALDNSQTREQQGWIDFFTLCDDVFLIIFTIEFLLKAFSFGFIWSDNVEFQLANTESLKELVLGNLGEPAYMYSGWNYLDMVVLTVGYIGKVGDPDGPLKALRLVRAFRPLRMVNRVKGMKLVLGALIAACPALANVCALLVAVFMIFAILGLSLFSGKFYYCTDGESDRDLCWGEFDAGGYPAPSVWKNPNLGGWSQCSFDNIVSSFLVLFEVATGDSWENILYCIIDSPNKIDEAPSFDNSRGWGMYLIIFVFVGQLFMLQLFVSVIIDSFNFAEGSGLLTGGQALYTDLLKLLGMLEPEPKPLPAQPSGYRFTAYNMFMDANPIPVNGLEEYKEKEQAFDLTYLKTLDDKKLDLKAYQGKAEGEAVSEAIIKDLQIEIDRMQVECDFLNSFSEEALNNQSPPPGWAYEMGKYFDLVITGCIMCSIVFMCTAHYEQSDTWEDIQLYQNYFFLSIFVFEFTVKHLGLGFGQYWSSPFDAFDGIVVLASCMFCVLRWISGTDAGAIAGLFRIGRVFRLIKRAPALRALMTSMIMVVPSISNVFTVLLLVFFVYAVIGQQLFCNCRYGFTLNQDNNFKTWQMAMLTLWRSTLGNWRQTFYDTQVTYPFCTAGIEMTVNTLEGGDATWKGDDCGTPYGSATPIISAFYHVSFQVFSTFAVLNVVIAIILGAFTWCYSLEQGELTEGLPVTADMIRHYKQIWDRFDLFSTGRIEIRHFRLFLAVVQWNIPGLFATGVRTQTDEMQYRDYASWGLGKNYDDPECIEAILELRAKKEYDELVRRLGRYERSKELWMQLDAADCDILLGCNDNVAGFQTNLHPLGSTQDADLHIFTKEVNNEIIHVATFDIHKPPPRIDVLQVTFPSLIKILALDPIGLDDHDVFVAYDYKDPFSYFQPGYFTDKSPVDGQVRLITDPSTIEPPNNWIIGGDPVQEPGETEINGIGVDVGANFNKSTDQGLPPPMLTVHQNFLHIESTEQVVWQDMVEYRYTLDGTEPTIESNLYNGPFSMDEVGDQTVRAKAFLKPPSPSEVAEFPPPGAIETDRLLAV